jgi:hypothetical protein
MPGLGPQPDETASLRLVQAQQQGALKINLHMRLRLAAASIAAIGRHQAPTFTIPNQLARTLATPERQTRAPGKKRGNSQKDSEKSMLNKRRR